MWTPETTEPEDCAFHHGTTPMQQQQRPMNAVQVGFSPSILDGSPQRFSPSTPQVPLRCPCQRWLVPVVFMLRRESWVQSCSPRASYLLPCAIKLFIQLFRISIVFSKFDTLLWNCFLCIVSYTWKRPGSIYQYSNMTPRLSGQTSITGVVFFVSKSLLGIEKQRNLKNYNFDPKVSEPC